jgi:hypothetical protein
LVLFISEADKNPDALNLVGVDDYDLITPSETHSNKVRVVA